MAFKLEYILTSFLALFFFIASELACVQARACTKGAGALYRARVRLCQSMVCRSVHAATEQEGREKKDRREEKEEEGRSSTMKIDPHLAGEGFHG